MLMQCLVKTQTFRKAKIYFFNLIGASCTTFTAQLLPPKLARLLSHTRALAITPPERTVTVHSPVTPSGATHIGLGRFYFVNIAQLIDYFCGPRLLLESQTLLHFQCLLA